MRHKTSLANKRRWAGVPKEERSKRMSALVSKRHAKMSVADRKKLGKRLALARKRAKRANI